MSRPLRRVAAVLVATPLVVGVLGMGSFGGRDAAAPLADVHARLVDVDGNAVDVTRLTVGGDVTLDGDLGRGRLRVPLDRIARIDVVPTRDDRDRLRATVTLRDGAPVTLVLRSATTFYGQVPSGAFQLRARDVRSVEIVR